jgi:hypothetical protein
MTPKVLTGNRLSDGVVIYLTADGTWYEWLQAARVAQSEAEEAALTAAGEEAVQQQLVVAPYLMEVRVSAAGPQPLKLREFIRASGPTVRVDVGKQSQAR